MKIGFDAKRAYQNYTGLGNYSRDLLKQIFINYPENSYCLYTPKSLKILWVPSNPSIIISKSSMLIIIKPM